MPARSSSFQQIKQGRPLLCVCHRWSSCNARLPRATSLQCCPIQAQDQASMLAIENFKEADRNCPRVCRLSYKSKKRRTSCSSCPCPSPPHPVLCEVRSLSPGRAVGLGKWLSRGKRRRTWEASRHRAPAPILAHASSCSLSWATGVQAALDRAGGRPGLEARGPSQTPRQRLTRAPWLGLAAAGSHQASVASAVGKRDLPVSSHDAPRQETLGGQRVPRCAWAFQARGVLGPTH